MSRERLRDPAVIVAALATLANLALVWGHRHVAAQDHLNHVASLRALRGLWEGTGFYVEHVTVVRAVVPDLLAEAIWFVALRPLGEALAGKVLVSLYVAGLPLAWWAFLRRYADGATTLLPLAPVVTMNLYYSLGSTNYLLGLPLFLLAAAAWDDVARGPRAVAVFVALAAATWWAHVYDYTLLVVFVAARVGAEALHRRAPNRFAWAAGLSLVAGFALAALAIATAEGGGAGGGPVRFNLAPWRLALHAESALYLRHGGGVRFAAAALALVPLSALAARRASTGSLRAKLWPPALLTALAAWLAPIAIGDESSIKERFSVPLVLLGMAAVAELPARWHRALAAGVFAAVFAWKWRDERAFHARFDGRVEEARALMAVQLPRHARVLPVSWWRRHTVEETVFHHLADLAAVERDAWLPDLFASPGQQILRHRRPWRGEPRAPADLTPAALVGFDFVWAQSDDPEALVAGVAGCVERVGAVTHAALYRVRPSCVGDTSSSR